MGDAVEKGQLVNWIRIINYHDAYSKSGYNIIGLVEFKIAVCGFKIIKKIVVANRGEIYHEVMHKNGH
jgi:hypothetical protein